MPHIKDKIACKYCTKLLIYENLKDHVKKNHPEGAHLPPRELCIVNWQNIEIVFDGFTKIKNEFDPEWPAIYAKRKLSNTTNTQNHWISIRRAMKEPSIYNQLKKAATSKKGSASTETRRQSKVKKTFNKKINT